jgi:hypothetical protein
VATFWALVPIAPFQFRQMGQTTVVVRKPVPKIEKGEALESLLHILNDCLTEFTTFIVND